jgi:hypothetical protein
LARGCPYACSYCYESKGARKLRRVPEERIAAELALFAEAGVGSVYVLDRPSTPTRSGPGGLLDLIAKQGKGMHFHFEVRAESLDRGLAKRFAAVDSSLQIGLQTARPEISEKVGRSLDRGLFASKIGLLNEEGVVFGLDLIYGLPGDDLVGFRGSLDYALGLYPNNLDVFRLAVLPGTALADDAAALGLRHDVRAPYLVSSTPTFPAADLDKAERLAEACDLLLQPRPGGTWFNQVLHPLSEKPSFSWRDFLPSWPSVAVPTLLTRWGSKPCSWNTWTSVSRAPTWSTSCRWCGISSGSTGPSPGPWRRASKLPSFSTTTPTRC